MDEKQSSTHLQKVRISTLLQTTLFILYVCLVTMRNVLNFQKPFSFVVLKSNALLLPLAELET